MKYTYSRAYYEALEKKKESGWHGLERPCLPWEKGKTYGRLGFRKKSTRNESH
jgi:hypothetical protein